MNSYPVGLTGRLDDPSRWMWLVKWLLAIPHFLVLAVLSIGFVLAWIGAFFGILFTGRYPRALFDYNVGVLRWSWRTGYYSYSVLGTDRYPPFALGDVPDYPARLEVEYPDKLSRGLVLVKWWLLAIPHYIIVSIFSNLIPLLVFCGAVALLFTGNYPKSIFDFVMAMQRWTIRTTAYAALMTDAYPPFRLDQGEDEPGASPTAATQAPVTA